MRQISNFKIIARPITKFKMNDVWMMVWAIDGMRWDAGEFKCRDSDGGANGDGVWMGNRIMETGR